MAATEQAGGAGEKGLREGTLGFLSGVVIGVASTAPGYSLAAVLGLHRPRARAWACTRRPILLLAFIPMLFIAAAFYYLNRADPDCGTTFSWVTRAMGPWLGWMAGWAVIAADIIVMANLADIAGVYSWILVGQDAPSQLAVLAVGVIWMVVDDGDLLRRHRGLRADAVRAARHGDPDARDLRDRRALEGRDDGHRRRDHAVARVVQSVRALVQRARRRPDPRDLHLLGLGLDRQRQRGVGRSQRRAPARRPSSRRSCCSASTRSSRSPRRRITASASSRRTATTCSRASAPTSSGSPWDKLLVIAVLTSASASCQTTILPATRSALSMAAKRAAPKTLGTIHPHFLTPERGDDLDGRHLGRLVRRPQADQRRPPLRRRRRRSA